MLQFYEQEHHNISSQQLSANLSESKDDKEQVRIVSTSILSPVGYLLLSLHPLHLFDHVPLI